MPVKLCVPTSSGHPPEKTPSEDFHMQTHSRCEQHSALHFNQSQQAINTTHPWGLEVTTASWEKKILWKKSEGWINCACSCLLYIWDVTKFMLLHRIFFFYKGWAGESSAKTRTKCLLCSSILSPHGRFGTWTLWCIFCKKSCNSVITIKRFFLFFFLFNFFFHSGEQGIPLHTTEIHSILTWFYLVTSWPANGNKIDSQI